MVTPAPIGVQTPRRNTMVAGPGFEPTCGPF